MRSITSSAVAHGFGGGERIARSVQGASCSSPPAPNTGSTISWRIWRSWCSSRPRRGPIRGERYESLLVGNYLSNRSDLFMSDQTASRSGSSTKLRWRVRQPGLQTKRNFHRLRGSPPLKAGRFNMPLTSRFGIGLLFIAGAIGLHFLSFVFQYVGYLLPASVPRGAGVILLRPPHALDSAEWPAACGGDCGRVDRRVLDCVARPRVPRAEPTSVHGPRGAWVRRLGCWRTDTNLVGSRTRIRVRPRPPWGPRRCRRGLRDCPRPDVLLASLGRRRLASPHRRSRRARHRLDQFGPHRPLEDDAKRWRRGNRSNGGGFFSPPPSPPPPFGGRKNTVSRGVPPPPLSGVIGRTHTLSGSSGITQFQDDFLDFFSARACKSFAVSRDGEPAFLHDSDRGDVVLGRAGVNRAYLYVPQKL